MLVIFIAIKTILLQFLTFFGHLVYFVDISVHFFHFSKLRQEKSGNSDHETVLNPFESKFALHEVDPPASLTDFTFFYNLTFILT
jgi:hypothetical protein